MSNTIVSIGVVPRATASPPRIRAARFMQQHREAMLRSLAVSFDLADRRCLTSRDAANFMMRNLQAAGYEIVRAEDLATQEARR